MWSDPQLEVRCTRGSPTWSDPNLRSDALGDPLCGQIPNLRSDPTYVVRSHLDRPPPNPLNPPGVDSNTRLRLCACIVNDHMAITWQSHGNHTQSHSNRDASLVYGSAHAGPRLFLLRYSSREVTSFQYPEKAIPAV